MAFGSAIEGFTDFLSLDSYLSRHLAEPPTELFDRPSFAPSFAQEEIARRQRVGGMGPNSSRDTRLALWAPLRDEGAIHRCPRPGIGAYPGLAGSYQSALPRMMA